MKSSLTLYDVFYFLISNIVESNKIANEILYIWLRQYDIISQQSFCALVYEKKNNIFFNETIPSNKNPVFNNVQSHSSCACRQFYDLLIWNNINTRFLTTVDIGRIINCCDQGAIDSIKYFNSPLFKEKHSNFEAEMGGCNGIVNLKYSKLNQAVKCSRGTSKVSKKKKSSKFPLPNKLKHKAIFIHKFLNTQPYNNNQSTIKPIKMKHGLNESRLSTNNSLPLTLYEPEHVWASRNYKNISKLSTCERYFMLNDLNSQESPPKHNNRSKKLTMHMINAILAHKKIKPFRLNSHNQDRTSLVDPYQIFDIIELYALYLCRYFLQRSNFEKLLPEYWQCMRRDYTKYVRQFPHQVINLITDYYSLCKLVKCNVRNLTFPIRNPTCISSTMTSNNILQIKNIAHKVIVPNLKGLHMIVNKNYNIIFIYDSAGQKITCCQSLLNHIKLLLDNITMCCIELVILQRCKNLYGLSSCYDVWNTSTQLVILVLTDVYMWNGENMLTISSTTRLKHLVPKFCQTVNVGELMVPCPSFENLNIFVNYFNAELKRSINFTRLYFDGVIVKWTDVPSNSIQKLKFSTAKYVLLSLMNNNTIEENTQIIEETINFSSINNNYATHDTSAKLIISLFQSRYQLYTIMYDIFSKSSNKVKLCLFDKFQYRHWCEINIPCLSSMIKKQIKNVSTKSIIINHLPFRYATIKILFNSFCKDNNSLPIPTMILDILPRPDVNIIDALDIQTLLINCS